MKESKNFERYQDFLNKRKSSLTKQNNNINIINLESKTEPTNTIKKQQKNVIQSCIESLKEQMKNNNKYIDKKQNISIHNLKYKTKGKIENSNSKSKILNKMNTPNNNNYYKRIKNEVQKNIEQHPEKLLYSDMDNNRTLNKIRRNYSNNHFSHNNLRYNFSSDFSPYNKELDHIISSYDFKNNDIGGGTMSAKIHFKNLLSLVDELRAKNDMLKKELKHKDNIISILEKKCLNKNKKGKKDDKNLNDILLNEYNNDLLLDNQKLKSEILHLNKELENQKNYYEDVIKDYKDELNHEKYKNNIFEGNFKEMENKFKNSNNRMESMEDNLEEAIISKSKLEEVNHKYEIINKNQQNRIEYLENQLNVVLNLVKGLFNKENQLLYPMRTKLFYEISNLNNIYQ
jgi:hypothetical protein